MSDDEFRQMLAAVSAEYRTELPDRIARIDALWELIIRGVHSSQQMDELIRALHKIAGSAETFGLTAVGQAAAAVESRLEPYRDVQQRPDAECQAEITQLLERLRHAAGVDGHWRSQTGRVWRRHPSHCAIRVRPLLNYAVMLRRPIFNRM